MLRIRKAFRVKDGLEALDQLVQNNTISPGDVLTLGLSIGFPQAPDEEGESHWKEYGNTLIRLYGAFARKRVPFNLEISLRSIENTLSHDVVSKMDHASGETLGGSFY